MLLDANQPMMITQSTVTTIQARKRPRPTFIAHPLWSSFDAALQTRKLLGQNQDRRNHKSPSIQQSSGCSSPASRLVVSGDQRGSPRAAQCDDDRNSLLS